MGVLGVGGRGGDAAVLAVMSSDWFTHHPQAVPGIVAE